jgi:thioredoxin-dependent peroxiredoxin
VPQNNTNMAVKVGSKAPNILGKDENGNLIQLSDFQGKKIVLYFYPKDNTSGCTAQACSLRDNYQSLKDLGYQVIGVSIDNEVSHQKFIQKFELPFPLIADTEKLLVETFGVWSEKSMYGKKYMGTVRTTFIINEQGTITHVIEGKSVNTKEHAAQLLQLIQS